MPMMMSIKVPFIPFIRIYFYYYTIYKKTVILLRNVDSFYALLCVRENRIRPRS